MNIITSKLLHNTNHSADLTRIQDGSDRSTRVGSRKVRSDSVLDRLTAEQKQRLATWLRTENRSYEAVRGLVAAEFGLSTSRAALGRYYRRWLAEPERAESRTDTDKHGYGEGAEGDGLEAWRDVADRGAVLEDAALVRARQLAFEALAEREPDLKTAQKAMRIVNGIERRRIAAERLALEARRVELDARRVTGGGSVTGGTLAGVGGADGGGDAMRRESSFAHEASSDQGGAELGFPVGAGGDEAPENAADSTLARVFSGRAA